MHRTTPVCVTAFILLLSPWSGSAHAGTNDTAKIALHLRAHTTKGSPCLNAPVLPCNAGESNLLIQGALQTTYDLYILVADGSPVAGIAGATVGIAYDGTPGSGVDVLSWTSCADLQFPGAPPGASWPDSGSGNVLTWERSGNCQNTPTTGDTDGGVTAILGCFSVFAYSPDVFSVTPRSYTPINDFAVVDCQLVQSDLAFPGAAGKVGFASAEGFDPCQQADTTAPGEVTLSEDTPQGHISSDSPAVISWHAPGDNGQSGGPASRYQLRCSPTPITNDLWLDAFRLPNVPSPAFPGEDQKVEVWPQQPGTTLYYALRTFDRAGNVSALSNNLAITLEDPDAAFSKEINLRGAELWVGGRKSENTSITIRYDGSTLLVDDQPITLMPLVSSFIASEDLATLRRVYGKIPSVANATEHGRTFLASLNEWRSSRHILAERASEVFAAQGLEAAYDYVAASPLVEKVHIRGSDLDVLLLGGLSECFVLRSRENPTESSPTTFVTAQRGVLARRILESLESRLSLRSGEGLLIIITGIGNMKFLSGSDAGNARAQIEFILDGGDQTKVPLGPLSGSTQILNEIVEANSKGGRQK